MRGTHPAPWWFEEYRRNPRHITADSLGFLNGIITAGSAVTAPNGDFTTGAAAANKVAEQIEAGAGIYDFTGGVGYWGRPLQVHTMMRPLNIGVNQSRCGLEIGSFGIAPPWPNPQAGQNIIQLFARFDAFTQDDWRLLINNGAAQQTVVIPLTTFPGPTINQTYHLMIDYNPATYVRAYINGQLVAEVRTAPLPNPTLVGQLFYGGVFVMTEGAASVMTARFNGLYSSMIGFP